MVDILLAQLAEKLTAHGINKAELAAALSIPLGTAFTNDAISQLLTDALIKPSSPLLETFQHYQRELAQYVMVTFLELTLIAECGPLSDFEFQEVLAILTERNLIDPFSHEKVIRVYREIMTDILEI